MDEITQQLEELAREVRLMRQAQQKYFKSRTNTALGNAKHHEAIVDRLLAKLPEPSKPVQGQLPFR